MTIDSHIHFWEYNKTRDAWMDGMEIIQRDFLPIHLKTIFQENNIDGCIAVQADQNEDETIFLLDLAKKNPQIKGIVGWIDLKKQNIEERLEYFSQFKIIKGWRHIVQAEPIGFLKDKDFLRGIAALKPYNYTYDILIYENQLTEALDFVNSFPEHTFIIDHCAKPDIKNNSIKNWENGIREIAKHPNVYCKVSGLFTEANFNQWKEGDFYPYLDIVFNEFGTDRLLFGSDWPVILLSGNYNQWKSLLEKYMQNLGLNSENQKSIFTNSIKIYNI